MEIWKPVVGYESMYKVSNLWNLISNNYRWRWNRVKKIYCNMDWYNTSQLLKKCELVHRLVAKAFIENTDNKEQVNHINWIKNDNRVENLEWCTRSENMKHAYKMWLQKAKKWNNHQFYWICWSNSKSSKLVNQYTLDWEFIQEFWSLIEIERTLAIDQASISRCCNLKSKSAGGFIWKFKEYDR